MSMYPCLNKYFGLSGCESFYLGELYVCCLQKLLHLKSWIQPNYARRVTKLTLSYSLRLH